MQAARVRVSVRVPVGVCAGVACMRDGVRADGADNARAGRARVQGVYLCLCGVLVWVLVFSVFLVSVLEVEEYQKRIAKRIGNRPKSNRFFNHKNRYKPQKSATLQQQLDNIVF